MDDDSTHHHEEELDHDPATCPSCLGARFLQMALHAAGLPSKGPLASIPIIPIVAPLWLPSAAPVQPPHSPPHPDIPAPVSPPSEPVRTAETAETAQAAAEPREKQVRVLHVDSKKSKARVPKMPVASRVPVPPAASPDSPEAPAFDQPLDQEAVAKAEKLKAEANMLIAKEDFLAAIETYTQAIETYPSQTDPHLAIYFANRALSQQKFANLGSAVIDASKAIQLDPQYVKAWYRRGTVQKLLGKPREALHDLKMVLALEPQNREVRAVVKELEGEVKKLDFAEAISGEAKTAESSQAVSSVKPKKKPVANKKPDAREWHVTASLAVLAARRIAEEISEIPAEYQDVLPEIDEVYLTKILPWLSWNAMQFYKKSSDRVLSQRFTSGKINDNLKMQDDFYRRLFASDRNHPILNNPHLNLLDPFDPKVQSFLCYTKPDLEEAATPHLFPQQVLREGPAICSSIDDFKTTFDVFSSGQLRFIDWNNVMLAGGSVFAALVPTPGGVRLDDYFLESPMYRGADIDLFLYDLTVEEANAKLRELYNAVERAIKETKPNAKLLAVRTQHAVSFVSDYPFRRVQVILRIFKSPSEILIGFDVDCCTAGFDGEKVWISPRCARALTTQTNLVDLSRRSASYEMRLYKYVKRGFSIAIPGLEKEKVKKFDKYYWAGTRLKEKGLSLLCLLEHLWYGIASIENILGAFLD